MVIPAETRDDNEACLDHRKVDIAGLRMAIDRRYERDCAPTTAALNFLE
jgi:hypothetical protein